MTNTIEQKVTKPENWLTYKEAGAEESVNNRLFGKIISRPDGSQPWDEWTAEQYDEWQEKYNPQPETELIAAEGCWLYKTCPADVHRDFMKSCTCPIDDVPNWNECTDQERIDYEEEWHRTHPEPQPQPEPSVSAPENPADTNEPKTEE